MSFVRSISDVSQRPRLLGAVGIALAMFVLVREDSAAVASFLGPLTQLTARITQAILSATGMESGRAANVLFHTDGFAYEVHYRCTGLVPIALFAVLNLSNPRSRARRIEYLAVGSFVLIVLNFVRLTHLFYVGVCQPTAFDFAHTVLWRSALVATVLTLAWAGMSGAEKGGRPMRVASRLRASAASQPSGRFSGGAPLLIAPLLI